MTCPGLVKSENKKQPILPKSDFIKIEISNLQTENLIKTEAFKIKKLGSYNENCPT